VVAEAETIHAHKHLNVLKGVGSTLDNLQEAVNGEHHEFTEMYPGFIAEAEKEGDQAARMSFHLANEVEQVHHKLYEKALQAVQAKQDITTEAFYLCPICGHVEENEAPGRCPICGAPGSTFKKY
jgi:rubrerythrin